jgi:hypothetical protein
MNPRFLLRAVLAISMFGAGDAWAQAVLSQNPAATAPQAASGLPDACKLMPQSDLEALFPGKPVTSKGGTLSAIYKGPQYNEACQYAVQLPDPTSKLDTTKHATLSIMRCGLCSKDRDGAAEAFASLREAKQKLGGRVEPLSGVGDDAFQVVSEHEVDIFARKDDLIFSLFLGQYSSQTQSNAAALAGQVAKRWSRGVGMIESATPTASNSGVDVPADTRMSLTAPPDQWPDACALLKPEDVRAVFGDMNVDPPRKTMGQIKYYSRVDRIENLPNPIRCDYDARKTEVVNGQRQTVYNSVQMSVSNVATTLASSKNHHASAQQVGDADTPVGGLGDEASISKMNQVYIRKGVINVSVRVGGGENDQALHADARKRVIELAKLVAAKLP